MQTLKEVRASVQAEGIQTIYQRYQVNSPHGVMLRVVFNLLYDQAYAAASTDDAKELLMYQKAIYELAAEEQIKNPSTYSAH